MTQREREREKERGREQGWQGGVGEEGRYREPGFIRSRNPWPYKNGWEFFIVFCCFHCILMGRVSKSGSSGESGEGILIKINHAGFGNKKPLGLASILTYLSSLISLIAPKK